MAGSVQVFIKKNPTVRAVVYISTILTFSMFLYLWRVYKEHKARGKKMMTKAQAQKHKEFAKWYQQKRLEKQELALGKQLHR